MQTSTMFETQRGRPRNENADHRILRATLDLYGEAGWHGVNLTKIATLAGIGKSSMYARWTDRESLLLDAFQAFVHPLPPVGSSPREILLNEATYRLHTYLEENSKAVRRVFVEMASSDQPIIRTVHDYVFADPMRRIRCRLWSFKSDGALPGALSVTRLLDAVEGSVLMRTFCLSPDDVECFLTEIPEYAESLVDDQLLMLRSAHHAVASPVAV